jgi:predicted alpha/beta hydrolase family esterase
MRTALPPKKCVIIHGCPLDEERALDPETRTYDKHWMPWLKRTLTEKGIETLTPLMPLPWSPNYERFKNEFEKVEITENTVLVGHSCGCAFLVQWLGESKRKIAKLVLVAPWKIPDGDDASRKAFYDFPIDPTIKDRVGEIVTFTSDNEEDDGKESVKMFHRVLGGKIVEFKNYGHFVTYQMGTEEFPELAEVICS